MTHRQIQATAAVFSLLLYQAATALAQPFLDSGHHNLGPKSTGPLLHGLEELAAEYDRYQQAQREPGVRLRTAEPFRPATAKVQLVGDAVLLEIATREPPAALTKALQGLGARVTGVSPHLVSALVPLDQLASLPNIASVHFARPALAIRRSGSVTSEGDSAQRSDIARERFTVSGAGQTVGILSDSFDCLGGYAADIGSSDLPDDVLVLEDYFGGDCTDEGRAMAQIVHDVAPGASLQFHTAFTGIPGFAQGILDLADAGADVIVDDVIYLAEPMFQDGLTAQAADQVTARGVAFFSAAGNNGRQSYEAPFRPSGLFTADSGPLGFAAEYHDFDPGAGTQQWQRLQLDGSFVVVMQWADPFFSVSGAPGAATDLDICFASGPSLDNLLGCALSDNRGGDPVELGGFADIAPQEAYIAVLRAAGPAPERIKYVWFGNGLRSVEFATDSPTTYGQANAAGAMAVGATAWFNTPAYGITPPVLNYFSATGGVPILRDLAGEPTYELRRKPEFAAPDGNNTTFFFADSDLDADTLPNFFGTSAAAPHAAAVAALMREQNPSLPPGALRDILQNTAVDINAQSIDSLAPGAPTRALADGFDDTSGAGLIDAAAALKNSEVALVPTVLRFGDLLLGSTARATLSLQNLADQTVTVSLTPTAAPYRLGNTTCGPEIAPRESCEVAVIFEPVANGTFTSSLETVIAGQPRETPLTGSAAGGVDWGETGSGGSGTAFAYAPSNEWAFAPQGSGVRDTRGFLSLTTAQQEGRVLGAPSGNWQAFGPLFAFTLQGGEPGTTAEVTYRLGENFSEDVRLWKYGPPSPGAAPGWYRYANAEVDAVSRTVTLRLEDGGAGDSDGQADGFITDPVGLFQFRPRPIPGLPLTALISLIGLMATASAIFFAARRRVTTSLASRLRPR